MSRPRLLDLFCGAGGAGEGYRRAGFDVTGVDLEPHDYIAGELVQADALEFLREHGREFDAVHASPPCHDHTRLGNAHGIAYGTGHLLAETLEAVKLVGLPYVVENVTGRSVRAAMAAAGHAPVVLCGSMFGLEVRRGPLLLQVRRHRLFAASFPFLMPSCHHRGTTLDVTGHSMQGREYRRRRELGLPPDTLEDRRQAMGLPGMDREALAESIPPAFTEFLGGMLLDEVPTGPAPVAAA